MNLATAQRTFASYENAVKALATALAASGETLETARWLVAVTPDGKRYVPTLVGARYVQFAHVGIQVVG